MGQVDSEVNVIIDGMSGANGWISHGAFAANRNPLKVKENWEGVPDWVLEVWAGNEKRANRITEKRLRWQKAGVAELWEVTVGDGQKIIQVYRLDQEGVYQALPIEGELICSEVIAGFCMEQAAIFANLVEE